MGLPIEGKPAVAAYESMLDRLDDLWNGIKTLHALTEGREGADTIDVSIVAWIARKMEEAFGDAFDDIARLEPPSRLAVMASLSVSQHQELPE